MEYRISNLWPTVKRIEIEYKISYPCSATNETMVAQGHAIFQPDFLPEFHFDCINEDCTGRGFELYSVVSSMIANKETSRSGRMECKGNESWKYSHACPSWIEYQVRIVFMKTEANEVK